MTKLNLGRDMAAPRLVAEEVQMWLEGSIATVSNDSLAALCRGISKSPIDVFWSASCGEDFDGEFLMERLIESLQVVKDMPPEQKIHRLIVIVGIAWLLGISVTIGE